MDFFDCSSGELAKVFAKDEKLYGDFYFSLFRLKEKINPNDEEVEAEAQKLLTRYASSKEADKKFDPARLRAYVSELLKRDKTFEFLEQL